MSNAMWHTLLMYIVFAAALGVYGGCVFLVRRVFSRPLYVLYPAILFGAVGVLLSGTREGPIPGVPGSSCGDLYYALPESAGGLLAHLLGFVLGVDAYALICCLLLGLLWLGDREQPLPLQDRCKRCGYLLCGLTDPRCPECGLSFDPARVNREPPPSGDRHHSEDAQSPR